MKLRRKRWLQGISSNVILLGVVGLLTDISSEMIHPLLPMFIVALGGGGVVVRLIGGLGDSLVAGFFWQHVGPQVSFVYGAGMSGLAALLFLIMGTKQRFHFTGEG